MAKQQLPDISQDELQAIAQWVFMNTMVDLEARINDPGITGPRYQMLGVAPLLRKLLIDGGTLVDRVNRRYRLDLEYEIVPFALDDLECFEILKAHTAGSLPPLPDIPYWRIFMPGALLSSDESPGQSLGRAHFLNSHVGVVSGHRLSVRELVKFYCIVEGGVHIGDPRKPYERDILRTVTSELVQPMHGVDGSPIGTLHSVGEIVRRALVPLMKAVTDDPAPLEGLEGFEVSIIGSSPFRGWWGGPELNRES